MARDTQAIIQKALYIPPVSYYAIKQRYKDIKAIVLILMGEMIIGGFTGVTVYICRTTDPHAEVKKLLFEDKGPSVDLQGHPIHRCEIMMDDGNAECVNYIGSISHKHWRGTEECDSYVGEVDMGDERLTFNFKAYPGKKRFMFIIGEYISPKDLKDMADYLDYEKEIGKSIIGDRTYTDEYRM